jgi:GT2 family glycosyltransferase
MSDKVPKVTIIIPHYNQKECLQRLLPSIDRQTFKDLEVIILDDHSPDPTTVPFIKDFIRDKPTMHLVVNAENMRFIKTCNKGITLAKGEYICLLNSDTEIAANFVERNVRIMDSDSGIGALSCVVVDQRGRNWFSGGRYRHGGSVNLTDDFQGLRQCDFVAGTAAFYRREIFDKIGLFDETYTMYHEDVEFGLRVGTQTHYRLCMFSDKLVTHYLVPSIPRTESYYYQSRNLFLILRQYSHNRAYYIYLMNVLFLHIPKAIAVTVLLSLRKCSLREFLASFRSLHMIRGAYDGLTKA